MSKKNEEVTFTLADLVRAAIDADDFKENYLSESGVGHEMLSNIIPDELEAVINVLNDTLPVVKKKFDLKREASVPKVIEVINQNEELLKQIQAMGFKDMDDFIKFQTGGSKPAPTSTSMGRTRKGNHDSDSENVAFVANFEVEPGVVKTYTVTNYVFAPKVMKSEAYQKHLAEVEGNNKFTYLYENSAEFRDYCKHSYKDWVFWLKPGMGGDVNQMAKPAFEQWLEDHSEVLEGMSKSEIKQKFYADTLKK